MSIERKDGKFVPTCDVCYFELDPENGFYDAVDAKKEAGWRSKKVKGEWEDICKKCQED